MKYKYTRYADKEYRVDESDDLYEIIRQATNDSYWSGDYQLPTFYKQTISKGDCVIANEKLIYRIYTIVSKYYGRRGESCERKIAATLARQVS